MAQKKGRQTSDPRTVQPRIRMTQDEADMLKECAESLNTTKTEVVVMGIRKVHADTKK